MSHPGFDLKTPRTVNVMQQNKMLLRKTIVTCRDIIKINAVVKSSLAHQFKKLTFPLNSKLLKRCFLLLQTVYLDSNVFFTSKTPSRLSILYSNAVGIHFFKKANYPTGI